MGLAADDFVTDWADENDRTGINSVDPGALVNSDSLFNPYYPTQEHSQGQAGITPKENTPAKPSFWQRVKAVFS